MTLILWLVAVYAAICAAAYFGNRLFMYFPDPTRVAPVAVGLSGVKEIEIAVADGITLIAWHAPAKDDKPTILYFHGNGANAASRAPKIRKDSRARLRRFLSQQPRLWRIGRTAYGERQCRRRNRGLRSPDRTRCSRQARSWLTASR